MMRVLGGDSGERCEIIGFPPKNIANGPLVSNGMAPPHIYSMINFINEITDDFRMCMIGMFYEIMVWQKLSLKAQIV